MDTINKHINVEDMKDLLMNIYMDGVEVIDNNKEIIETFGGAATDLIEAIKVLKKIAEIPTQLYLIKFEKFCNGIIDIPSDKREKYLKAVTKKSVNEDNLFILNVLNRIENDKKIDIIVRILETRMDNKIDKTTYERLVIMIDRTLYQDIVVLIQLKNNECEYITPVEKMALEKNGWINFVGMSWSELGGDKEALDSRGYRLSEIAEVFLDITGLYFGCNNFQKAK